MVKYARITLNTAKSLAAISKYKNYFKLSIQSTEI